MLNIEWNTTMQLNNIMNVSCEMSVVNLRTISECLGTNVGGWPYANILYFFVRQLTSLVKKKSACDIHY